MKHYLFQEMSGLGDVDPFLLFWILKLEGVVVGPLFVHFLVQISSADESCFEFQADQLHVFVDVLELHKDGLFQNP